MPSERDKATENPYKAPIAGSRHPNHRLSYRWYVGGMIVGGIGVLCSLYYASYAVWLNAHPLYDDEYWAQQFYIAAVAFLISLVVAIGGVIGVAARRAVK
jgi:hypothetical protein